MLLYTWHDKLYETFSYECHKTWFGCLDDKISQEMELDQIVDQMKSCPTYGSILMDDMTDVTSKEQMFLFMQYYCRKEGKAKTKFVSVESAGPQQWCGSQIKSHCTFCYCCSWYFPSACTCLCSSWYLPSARTCLCRSKLSTELQRESHNLSEWALEVCWVFKPEGGSIYDDTVEPYQPSTPAKCEDR